MAIVAGSVLVTKTEVLCSAQDVNSAVADIDGSSDFRVRVSAALVLGRAKPPGARQKLEVALSDAHPAVRMAAAAGLSALGDPAAIRSLEHHAREEQMMGVRAKMLESATRLRGSDARSNGQAADGQPTIPVATGPRVIGQAKYVLELGAMRNTSGVRDDQFSGVMALAAKKQLEQKGAFVLAANEGGLKDEANRKKIPVYRIEGQLSRLSQQQASDGSLTMLARVEFSVVKVPQHTLQGTLSGAASTQGSLAAFSNETSMSQLREQVIGGAVESAMQNADRNLLSNIH